MAGVWNQSGFCWGWSYGTPGKSSPACLQAQVGAVMGCGWQLVTGESRDGRRVWLERGQGVLDKAEQGTRDRWDSPRLGTGDGDSWPRLG